jgi:superfamily II DNA or RNA helicase/tetratricopeptide (TPR) repeat protein
MEDTPMDGARGLAGGRGSAAGYRFQDEYTALKLAELLSGTGEPIDEVIWEKRSVALGGTLVDTGAADLVLRLPHDKLKFVQVKLAPPSGNTWTPGAFVKSGVARGFWNHWQKRQKTERGRISYVLVTSAPCHKLRNIISGSRRCELIAELEREVASYDYRQLIEIANGLNSEPSQDYLEYLRAIEFEYCPDPIKEAARALVATFSGPAEVAELVLRLVAESKKSGKSTRSSFTRATLQDALKTFGAKGGVRGSGPRSIVTQTGDEIVFTQDGYLIKPAAKQVGGRIGPQYAWCGHLLPFGANVITCFQATNLSETAIVLLRLLTTFTNSNRSGQAALQAVFGQPTPDSYLWPTRGLYQSEDGKSRLVASFDQPDEEVLFIWLFSLAFSTQRLAELDRALRQHTSLADLQSLRARLWAQSEDLPLVAHPNSIEIPIAAPEMYRLLLASQVRRPPLDEAWKAASAEDYSALAAKLVELSNSALSAHERAEVALLEAALRLANNEITLASNALRSVPVDGWPHPALRFNAALILATIGEVDRASALVLRSKPETTEVGIARLRELVVHFIRVLSGRTLMKRGVSLIKWATEIESLPIENSGDRIVRIGLARLCIQTRNTTAAESLLSALPDNEDTPSLVHLRGLVLLQLVLDSTVENPDRSLSETDAGRLREALARLSLSEVLVAKSGTEHQLAVFRFNLGSALHISADTSSNHRRDVYTAAAEKFDLASKAFLSDHLRSESGSLAAQCWLKAGEPSRCVESLKNIPSTRLSPGARSNLVTSLLLMGETSRALEELDSLFGSVPLVPWQALYSTAVVLQASGQSEWAARALRAARPYSKRFVWAVDRLLGLACLSLEQYGQAEASLRAALDVRPFDLQIYRVHFQAFEKGTVASARRLLTHLTELLGVTHEDQRPLDNLSAMVRDAVGNYSNVIGRFAGVDAAGPAVAGDLSRVLKDSDRVSAVVANLIGRLGSQAKWQSHEVVQIVEESLFDSSMVQFVPGQPITTGDMLAECDWKSIQESAEGVSRRLDTPVVWEPLDASPLAHFDGTNRARIDAKAHLLNLLARRASGSHEVPLLCFDFTSGVYRKSYQQRVVQTILSHFHGRALLADEPGLGKTIEACLILTEYKVRRLVKRCLILVPSIALVEQWMNEISDKFPLLSRVEGAIGIYRHPSWRGWDKHDLCIATFHAAASQKRFITEANWDMLIVDEAHHLGRRGSRIFKLASSVSARYILLLSGTPICRDDRSDLFSLISLVRPTLFRTLSRFAREFGRKDVLASTDARRLQEILSQVMIRNSLAGVGPEVSVGVRAFHNPSITLSVEENAFYRAVVSFVLERAKARERLPLSYYVLAREASSSAAAALSTIRTMIKSVSKGEVQVLDKLERLAKSIPASGKIEFLRQIAKDVSPRKVLVFVEFRASAQEIAATLDATVLQGAMLSNERNAALAAFSNDAKKQLLVVTPGMYEGLNFQMCSVVVNYDLPWNPVRIEQRIGRVQRIGQTHGTIDIYSLAAVDTIEEDIRDGLVRKVKVFEQMFGSIDLLLEGDGGRQGFQKELQNALREARDPEDLREKIKALFDDKAAAQMSVGEEQQLKFLGEIAIMLSRERSSGR